MRIDRLAAGAFTAAAVLAAAPAPALAHGAPTTPISRTAACADGGEETGNAACKAARKANGRGFGNFDNLRIADVNGKDREVVPDGELCSGGLDAFKGLDLARDDFPATKVTPGQNLKINYRATIPHAGEFRIFLTKPAYDPEKALTWDDLGSKPLASVTDPDLNDGAYQLRAKLPARTGRHMLYIVWETSQTPDTYYSCSDLVFPAAAAKATKAPPQAPATTRAAPAVRATSATPKPTPTSAKPATAAPEIDLNPVAAQKDDTSQVTLGHWIIAGALILGFAAIAWAGTGAILRRRRENR
ncbi:lytic polysaccharide monooxygenase [Actinoplanes sp. LDG1-06]|uniref:Lytic polysaccharide monooxygenase n=1 Tax=Paractinoplanes ovalisporus TaxID=2810368 RepID=A0ABS2ALJ0_9ACTN|nr:lytic polysaccharide monooxygenase [Actinoplanes ovalisporus]MBM2620074.1 lytic polysaccharide monooxygenase [Actinoplanes ovalisporus]